MRTHSFSLPFPPKDYILPKRIDLDLLQIKTTARVHWWLVTLIVSERPRRYTFIYISFWRCDPTRVIASSFLRFLDHTQWHTTVGRTPLDEWSARRRDLYLTTHNTHNRQTSVPSVGFEPTISAGVRPQTYALDRVATGTGRIYIYIYIYIYAKWRRLFTLLQNWPVLLTDNIEFASIGLTKLHDGNYLLIHEQS